ncbi:hypothetical protein [Paenibacillus lautus]|uniref:hypothetical protein n=1 Tax=Paenibacillus lautus TaxID=1401 RepID=UPI003D288CE6
MKGLESKQNRVFGLREKTGVAAKFPAPAITVTSMRECCSQGTIQKEFIFTYR